MTGKKDLREVRKVVQEVEISQEIKKIRKKREDILDLVPGPDRGQGRIREDTGEDQDMKDVKKGIEEVGIDHVLDLSRLILILH